MLERILPLCLLSQSNCFFIDKKNKDIHSLSSLNPSILKKQPMPLRRDKKNEIKKIKLDKAAFFNY